METTEMNKMVAAAYDRRVRELASELAQAVSEGLMSEQDANEMMARKQDAWSDSPWG